MSTNIVVPELGESVVEARVAKWLKKEGDAVNAGDPLVELETEKIDLEVSADRAGVLSSIKHGEGTDVKVGEVLGTLDQRASPGAEAPAPDAAKAADAAKPAAAANAASAAHQPVVSPAPSEVKATPTARNVAREEGITLDSIAASGAGGRVMKQDVLRATAAPKSSAAASPPAAAPPLATPAPAAAAPPAIATRPAPAAPAPGTTPGAAEARREERVRMSKRRATIARRLVEAQHNAAMLTTFNEVDMTAVMSLRERRKEAFQRQYGVGLGIASFFVKAAVNALTAFPQINAEIQGDEMVLKHYYDVGMAVGAEGGLVVPVIRDADRKSFAEIELAIRDFAKRAQDGTLTLEDLKGGTFTITNGGVFGSLMSTPILNPPQVGILGLHKIADRPVAVTGQVVVRPMMYVALSYDHRIVDGREAVQFLVRIKDYIEDPALMVIA
jgi:2-oxoglutarate dehydrogenase E2 component (dihydrolipoamide succinyltransferase)